jgi:Ca2+-binding RTX toxin-like protein
MAWQYPQSTTSDATIVTLDEDGESVFIAPQVFIATTALSNGNTLPAIHATSINNRIVIAGTVSGNPLTVGANGNIDTGSTVTLEESGQVRSFFGDGIFFAGLGSLTNHGLITSDSASGVTFYSESIPDGVSTLINTGTIEGETQGVRHFLGGDTLLVVKNTGTIKGGAYSFLSEKGSAFDHVTNSGKMIGDVDLGAADDLYDGRLGTIQGNVFGGDGKDRLYAGAGNDALSGQAGDDTLMGGAGADYLGGGAGSDRAAYTSAKAGVTVSLANASLNTGDAKGDTFNSVENLVGSNFSDNLFGDNARNVISGGAGNDTIKGYRGNDVLAGGTGKDIFVFNSALSASTNVDTITDFLAVDDTIQLDNAVFTALAATGVMASGAFRVNTTGLAQDSSDRIIYETDTGELYYDANGNAAGGGVLFAKLDPGLALTNADFVVI